MNKQKFFHMDKTEIILFLGIILLGLCLRLFNLNTPLWGDETTSWAIARRTPFIEMWRIGQYESSPTLYPSILHFSIKVLGTSPSALRLPSVIFGVAVLPLVFFSMRQVTFNVKTSLQAMTLAAVSSMLIFYSQEARAYALFVFFSILSLYLLVRCFNQPKLSNFIMYAASLLMVSLSHRYGLFLILAEVICIVIYKKWGLFKVTLVALGLIIFDLIIQLQNVTFTYGIAGRKTDWQAFFDLINTFNAGVLGMQNLNNMPNANLLKFPIALINQFLPVVALIVYLIIFYIGATNYKKLRPEKKQFLIILSICVLIPIFLALIAGSPLSPLPQWLLRGIIMVIPFYFMAATIAISKSRYNNLLIGAIIAINVLTLIPYYSTYSRFENTVAFIHLNNHTTEEDLIISDPWYMINFIDYYYDGPSSMIAYDSQLGWIDAERMNTSNIQGIVKIEQLPDNQGDIFVWYRTKELAWIDEFPDNTIYVWNAETQLWEEYPRN